MPFLIKRVKKMKTQTTILGITVFLHRVTDMPIHGSLSSSMMRGTTYRQKKSTKERKHIFHVIMVARNFYHSSITIPTSVFD